MIYLNTYIKTQYFINEPPQMNGLYITSKLGSIHLRANISEFTQVRNSF